MENKFIISADIGGSSVKMGLFEIVNDEEYNDLKLINKFQIPTVLDVEDARKKIFDDIVNVIKKELEEKNISIKNVVGIGIGVPGPVQNDVEVKEAVNILWKTPTNIKEEINKRFDDFVFTVSLNDANAAALGECFYGQGINKKSLCVITIGTGIGCGIVIDKKIVNGYSGHAGEIGHITVCDEEDAKICTCKRRGCLERYSSSKSILDTYYEKYKENISLEELCESASENEKKSYEILNDAMEKLSRVIVMISNIINPEVFLIGGGITYNGDTTLSLIKNNIKEKISSFDPDINVEYAKLRNDAGIWGLAKYVKDEAKIK